MAEPPLAELKQQLMVARDLLHRTGAVAWAAECEWLWEEIRRRDPWFENEKSLWLSEWFPENPGS